MASSTSYAELVQKLRNSFDAGRTKDIEWRRTQLKALIKLLDDQHEAICEALKSDLSKCRTEAMLVEVTLIRNEAVLHLDNLERWTKPQPVKKDLMAMMDTCYMQPQPLGVALIIGAWNYPFQVSMIPLVGAIAAGNCVILKPSEMAPKSAEVMQQTIEKYLDTDCIKVELGGIPETTSLLEQKFDHIFYTGNSTVGKIIMAAAAKHLTSVTLELGGKSPVYVDKESDMDIVANRIMWGKLMNNGQTCIAPDYIMCSSEVQKELLPKLKNSITKFFGEDPQASPDLARVINERHFKRLAKFLDNGEVYCGGKVDEAEKYISPTVLTNVTSSDLVMKEEIFGPVLPVLTMETLADAINYVNSGEKPLASYLFSKNKEVISKWTNLTTSGGTCINDTVMHGSLPTLPFGGVGNSGMGSYHGKFTFNSFTHYRAVMIKDQKMEAANELRYPPYTDKKYGWTSWLMKNNPKKKKVPTATLR